MPPSHGGDQGFESPTGYQKPLTIFEWFFAFLISFFAEVTKTEAQKKKGVRIPYGLSETTHIIWVVVYFCFSFLLKPRNRKRRRKWGSNPLRAIRNHSHSMGGFLLFYFLFCWSHETIADQKPLTFNERFCKYLSTLMRKINRWPRLSNPTYNAAKSATSSRQMQQPPSRHPRECQ